MYQNQLNPLKYPEL